MIRISTLFLLFLLMSCESSDESKTNLTPRVIFSRDIAGPKIPLYRVKVPNRWRWFGPAEKQSLQDTMKPLAEWLIDGAIHVTIHNFPNSKPEERIPPIAQITRWKRQFQTLDPSDHSIALQSFSGYQGYLFEGTGILDTSKTCMMCWILQISNDHYHVLSRPKFHPQMRADVTIKAVGPANLVKTLRDEMIMFARSFELIEEIPSE